LKVKNQRNGNNDNQGDNVRTFITSQKILAKQVGCSEVHLTRIKKRTSGVSEKLALILADKTRISSLTWAAGQKTALKRQLDEFFKEERILQLASKGKVKK
jgi:hypothetical protein